MKKLLFFYTTLLFTPFLFSQIVIDDSALSKNISVSQNGIPIKLKQGKVRPLKKSLFYKIQKRY